MWLSLTNEIKPRIVVIYNRAIVALMSECCVKIVIWKTRTGLKCWGIGKSADQDLTPQNAVSYQGLTVCLNYRKLRVKWNTLKSMFRTIIPAYTQRQSAHQCCQCFDCCSSVSLSRVIAIKKNSVNFWATNECKLLAIVLSWTRAPVGARH